jgi:hypothetical protein
MNRYGDYLLFECTFHNVFIFPHAYLKVDTKMLPFFIIEEDIQRVVAEWLEKLWSMPNDELEQLETNTKRR